MDFPVSGSEPVTRTELPVWFYIGVLLLVYGVILLGAGLFQLFHPPHTVLANYHATLWGGVVLLLIGGGYTVAFWPRRAR